MMRQRTSRRSDVSRDRQLFKRSRLTSLLLLVVVPIQVHGSGFLDLWLTPDQQGQRLYGQEKYLEAAETFTDPSRRAAAYYRAGEFEQAAALYGAIAGPEAAFNRGNALVLLGRYEEAIASYETALERRSDWAEASENRDIARVRLERRQPPDDDHGGTGGQLEADEIVFDDSGRVNKGGTDVESDGGEMTDEAMRAVWLRRVQGDPADFLRARFAYQLYRDEQEDARAPADD